jgi:hypothetical protein
VQTSIVQSIKLAIAELTGLSKDALHVYVGLACFVFRSCHIAPASSIRRPAACRRCRCGYRRAVDMLDDLSSLGHWRWEASLHDVLNTLFWPTMIWLLARLGFLFADSGRSDRDRTAREI